MNKREFLIRKSNKRHNKFVSHYSVNNNNNLDVSRFLALCKRKFSNIRFAVNLLKSKGRESSSFDNFKGIKFRISHYNK